MRELPRLLESYSPANSWQAAKRLAPIGDILDENHGTSDTRPTDARHVSACIFEQCALNKNEATKSSGTTVGLSYRDVVVQKFHTADNL